MKPKKLNSSLKPAAVTLLTNQAYVLMYLAERPVTKLSAIARRLRLTERAIQRIISLLIDQGFLTRTRDGQRIHYRVHTEKTIRHPMVGELTVGALLELARQRHGRTGSDTDAMARGTTSAD